MAAARAGASTAQEGRTGSPWKESALYGLDLGLRLFWFLVSVLGLAPCVGWLTVESEVGRYLEGAAGDQLKLGEYHRMSEQDPLRLLDGLHPSIREALFHVPRVAAPTMLLWLAAASLMAVAVALHVHEWIGAPATVALITVAMLAMFTVAHEAAHGSISSVRFVNGLFGRLSFPCLGPLAVFGPWRTIHLLHHKHTNDRDRDPDHFCCEGSGIMLPVRWALLIFQYTFFWLLNEAGRRPLAERVEAVIHLSCTFALLMVAVDKGLLWVPLLYWVAPSCIANTMLAFLFDYLPHHDHDATPAQSRYETTSMLHTYASFEALFTVVMQYQNYHIIHHLYPQIPFYRYADKWRQHKERLLNEKHIKIRNVVLPSLPAQS